MARMSEELRPECLRRRAGARSPDGLERRLQREAADGLGCGEARRGAYPVTDELFIWSDAGVRPMNAVELAEHGRG
jgi:hypothetical protein